MKKKEPCYICHNPDLIGEKKRPAKPAVFFFITTLDYQGADVVFDANNPPEFTDPKNTVAACNDHVEDLKLHFRDEEIREVPYEEWIVHGVMTS